MTNVRRLVLAVFSPVLLLAGGLTASLTTSDWSQLRADQIVIFVGDCGYSQLAWQGVERAAPAISRRFVPAPVTKDERLEKPLCQKAFERLPSWLGRARKLFPERRCHAFANEARARHRRSFALLPAYSLGAWPIPLAAEDVVFAKLGLQRKREKDGTTTFSEWKGSHVSQATREAFNESAIFVPIGY